MAYLGCACGPGHPCRRCFRQCQRIGANCHHRPRSGIPNCPPPSRVGGNGVRSACGQIRDGQAVAHVCGSAPGGGPAAEPPPPCGGDRGYRHDVQQADARRDLLFGHLQAREVADTARSPHRTTSAGRPHPDRASTAHRILKRHGVPVLAALDRATRGPVRRYERSRPGELIHIDVKELGRIPDGGGHRTQRRAEGRGNRTGTRLRLPAHRPGRPLPPGLHRRPARRDRPDLRRLPHPRHRMVRRPGHHRRTGPDRQRLGLQQERLATDLPPARHQPPPPRWTRPWRPQINGKVERFHRTLLEAGVTGASDRSRPPRAPGPGDSLTPVSLRSAARRRHYAPLAVPRRRQGPTN